MNEVKHPLNSPLNQGVINNARHGLQNHNIYELDILKTRVTKILHEYHDNQGDRTNEDYLELLEIEDMYEQKIKLLSE